MSDHQDKAYDFIKKHRLGDDIQSPADIKPYQAQALVALSEFTINVDPRSLFLKDDALKDKFVAFCKQEFSQENYFCYNKLQDIKSASDPVVREQLVSELSAEFIGPDATSEVNLDGGVVKQFKTELAQGQVSDALLESIETVINRNLYDTMSRFQDTTACKQRLSEIEVSVSGKDKAANLILADTMQSKLFAKAVVMVTDLCKPVQGIISSLGAKDNSANEGALNHFKKDVFIATYDLMTSANKNMAAFHSAIQGIKTDAQNSVFGEGLKTMLSNLAHKAEHLIVGLTNQGLELASSVQTQLTSQMPKLGRMSSSEIETKGVVEAIKTSGVGQEVKAIKEETPEYSGPTVRSP